MALQCRESILSRRDEMFELLPSEQRATEESLIQLERDVIASSRKNEFVLDESTKIVEQSDHMCE